jgi:hypothetical protein
LDRLTSAYWNGTVEYGTSGLYLLQVTPDSSAQPHPSSSPCYQWIASGDEVSDLFDLDDGDMPRDMAQSFCEAVPFGRTTSQQAHPSWTPLVSLTPMFLAGQAILDDLSGKVEINIHLRHIGSESLRRSIQIISSSIPKHRILYTFISSSVFRLVLGQSKESIVWLFVG